MKNHLFAGFGFLIILGLILILSNGCKKDDATPEPTDPEENVIETTSGIIGQAGGTLELKDGASVNIPSGSLSGDVSITFSKIGNDQYFNQSKRNVYELSGIETGTLMNLSFPCPAGLKSSFIGVFNYDQTKIEGTAMDFAYDSISGGVKVASYQHLKHLKSDGNYKRWIVEWGTPREFVDKTVLIPMPFYEQIGGSCWATDVTMLTKAYSPYADREAETEVYHYLKAIGLGIDDGIGIYNFMKVLDKKFHLYSNGAGALTESYFNKNNLLNAIIERLDEKRPVVLYMPNHAHAVLVVGYRTYLNLNGYDETDLIIHDSKGTNPPSADEGCMYTSRKWSWFLKDACAQSLFLMLTAATGVNESRALQTVGLPTFPSGKTEMSFSYYKTAGGSKGTISLTWDPNHPDGYKWTQNDLLTFEKLPPTVSSMNFKLQLFNADMDASENVILNIKVSNLTKGKNTFMRDYPLTLPNSPNPYYFELALDTSEWLKNFGDTATMDYTIQTRLSNSSGIYQDGWTLNFKASTAIIAVGQPYQGGIIFYVDNTGKHGLIVQSTDTYQNAPWGCEGTSIPGTSTAMGTGQANTTKIVNGCSDAGIAARICNDLVHNGYSDWYLPSKDELYQLYLQRTVIGGLGPCFYYSSSEFDKDQAYFQQFDVYEQESCPKANTGVAIRAIRSF
ncbi:MAG: hypothetical protein IPH45_14340 [Bacteroidales bacterium]|nr:hypothetical protein [Bacteroidales bacterium]